MEPTFLFQPTPLDAAALRPQVRRALERRTELLSRQKYPRLWAATDRLNRGERVPKIIAERRKRRRALLGLLDWALGLFLLIPGLMDPKALAVPLAVGALCFGAGTVILWRNRRAALGLLSLLAGLILSLGALINPVKLGPLLLLGLAGLVIGAAALVRRRGRTDAFDRAAEKLLGERTAAQGMEGAQVLLSPAGLSLRRRGAEIGPRPLSLILETEDLLLLFGEETVTVLQKKDLCRGTLPALREVLGAQIPYETVLRDD